MRAHLQATVTVVCFQNRSLEMKFGCGGRLLLEMDHVCTRLLKKEFDIIAAAEILTSKFSTGRENK